jgi:glycosyltransferase involved in cell wall biosynthesis
VRTPRVSVVVPVRNGAGTVAGCVRGLLRQDYPSERLELLVVDNGSTDGTAETLRELPVRVLAEPRRGAARARNRGIVEAGGDVLAFTDADCLPTTGWVRELVTALERPQAGGAAGEILPFPPRTGAERHAARIRHLSPQRYLRRPLLPFAVTANLAFRRDVFDTVGLFDPASPTGGESTDFCTRFFRATGLELTYAPRAVVFHRHRASLGSFVRQQWSYGQGHAWLYAKYAAEVQWGRAQTAHVYRDLGASLVAAAVEAGRWSLGRSTRREASFRAYEALRKAALRAGFVRGSLARGYLRL